MNREDRLREQIVALRLRAADLHPGELGVMESHWRALPHGTRFERRANLARSRVFKEELSRRADMAAGLTLVDSITLPGHYQLRPGTVGGEWSSKWEREGKRIRVCRRQVRACGFYFPVTVIVVTEKPTKPTKRRKNHKPQQRTDG